MDGEIFGLSYNAVKLPSEHPSEMISVSLSVIQTLLCYFRDMRLRGRLSCLVPENMEEVESARGKRRLFLVFLQIALRVLLPWFNTCGSTTLHTGLFSGSESSTSQ